MRSRSQAVPKTVVADYRTLTAAALRSAGKEQFVRFQSRRSFMPSLDALLTWWQFTEGRTEAGRTFVIVFVLLLLAGGIFLVARSVIDLVRSLKSSKRSEDVHRKKAA
jgi:hypothetical protein